MENWRKSQSQKEKTDLAFQWAGIGDSECASEADDTLVFLTKVGIGEGEATLCRPSPESARGLDVRNHSQGCPARVSSVSLNFGISSAHSWTWLRPRVHIYGQKLIDLHRHCIDLHKITYALCGNFHCACFRIELTLSTEYFSFTEKETSGKEEEFVFLWNGFWEWALKERNRWRLLFFSVLWKLPLTDDAF